MISQVAYRASLRKFLSVGDRKNDLVNDLLAEFAIYYASWTNPTKRATEDILNLEKKICVYVHCFMFRSIKQTHKAGDFFFNKNGEWVNLSGLYLLGTGMARIS